MNLEFQFGQQSGAIHNEGIALDGIARDDGRGAAFRYTHRFFPPGGSEHARQPATDFTQMAASDLKTPSNHAMLHNSILCKTIGYLCPLETT